MAKIRVKRNHIVVASLALMIAVAGYLSYTGIDSMEKDGILSTASLESAELETMDTVDVETEQPGEAVLTSSSNFVAQAKVDREQVRAANKEILNEIINNEGLSEDERQAAVASMVEITDLAEKEAAAETMLEAKGFKDVVVNLIGGTADVMVPADQLSDTQRAQIEDIIIRKTEISGENIVITPMNETVTESP